MKITSYQFTFEKPAFDKNLLLRCSVGAAIGAGLKGAIILLSGTTFSPLPFLGWSVAGAILAIATKFFKKVQQHNKERFLDPAPIPALNGAAVETQKTLHQLFEEKWDSILENNSFEDMFADKSEDIVKQLDLKLKEGDTFFSVWNPRVFSVAVIDFAHSKGFLSQTPKEAWDYAAEHVEAFAEHLIDIKLKKKNLEFFQDKAERFLRAYIPVRRDGTFIRGKQDKNLFENELKNYITCISSFLD